MTTDAKISPTSQRTQARIIDAVVNTVAAHGISGTTLAHVAASAGVSQGVLVFHFKSKEGLLTETLLRLTREYRDAWQAASLADDPLDRITGLVRTDFSPAICTRRKLALWFAFWGEARAKPLYNSICEESEKLRYEAMVAACTAYVDAHGGPAPELLAHSIDGMTDGLWLQLHIYGQSLGRAAALDKALGHLRLLLPGATSRI